MIRSPMTNFNNKCKQGLGYNVESLSNKNGHPLWYYLDQFYLPKKLIRIIKVLQYTMKQTRF